MVEFVAEFTTNHMGNLNVLLRMVEEASKAGASFIKMQKKDVHTFYSKEKLESLYPSPYGKTYQDYRSIFEFEEEDFARLDDKCKECGIEWFATSQDLKSLEFLLRWDLPMYKIASSNSRNDSLLREMSYMIPKDKTVVLSVAGSSLEEIERSLNFFPKHNIKLLHCVAEYPCKKENLRLGNIQELKFCFGCSRIQIGYSGHEVGVLPTYAAVDMGASMIERHFCLSRDSFVHHIECSLEPLEFKVMVDTINSSKDIKPLYEKTLSAKSFTTDFGMTEKEKSFLVNQTYGTDYLFNSSR